MKPSPAQLAAFTQAARDRSFSAAARSLGVTQSAVTQHVAALEKRMGQQLFIRSRRGLELTRAATALFEITDRMIMLQDLAAERIGEFSKLETGQLQIIANSPRPALPLIARFNARYPQIEISFTLVSWTEATRRLADHDVDAAIISAPPSGADLVSFELNQSRFVAYIHVDDPLADIGEVSLMEVAKRGLILPEEGSLTQKTVRSFASRKLIDLGPVLQTTTFPVVQEAVLHKVGIGVMLENSLTPHPMIRQIPIQGLSEKTSCCLLALREKRWLNAIDRFFQEAAASVAG